MKFGLFDEMETPRPSHERSEYNVYWEALAQIELADRVGFDYVWEVEHHFLEEYSQSPAPEVFYGAVTQRTKNIRIVIVNLFRPMRALGREVRSLRRTLPSGGHGQDSNLLPGLEALPHFWTVRGRGKPMTARTDVLRG